MLFAEFGSGQVLWSTFWIFMFVIWFWLLIAIFGDLFRDRELSGWAKAAWSLFVIVLPYLGIFVYLIVRGHGMADRALAQQQAQQARFDSYVRETAGGGSAADEVLKAKQLLDSGAISEAEFQRMKAAALG
jgi:hypothetical protein